MAGLRSLPELEDRIAELAGHPNAATRRSDGLHIDPRAHGSAVSP